MNQINNRYTPSKLLPWLMLLLGFVSVNQWSKLPIGNTTTTWLLDIGILITLYLIKSKNKLKFSSRDYLPTTLFLCIAAVGLIRGAFVAENYWEQKNLINNAFILLMPLCTFAFYDPRHIQASMRVWFKYALIAYALFFFWMVGLSQFYLAPIFFAASFIPLIPKGRWKTVIILLAIALLLYQYQDNRSQAIKAAVALSLSCACIFHKRISLNLIKTAHVLLIIIPCVFIYLGVTGAYNFFEDTHDNYAGRNTIETAEGELDIVADTRSFIYTEVLSSAVNNDYVIFGRTPARGNDTSFFYDIAQNLRSVKHGANIKNERSQNEVCFPNIFTWLGLVGMIAYILIYLHASVLAIYKSNSFYMKLIGLYIAFNFAFGWVENSTSFDILNFVYWFAISMALSSRFRAMTDEDFSKWFAGIFYTQSLNYKRTKR